MDGYWNKLGTRASTNLAGTILQLVTKANDDIFHNIHIGVRDWLEAFDAHPRIGSSNTPLPGEGAQSRATFSSAE